MSHTDSIPLKTRTSKRKLNLEEEENSSDQQKGKFCNYHVILEPFDLLLYLILTHSYSEKRSKQRHQEISGSPASASAPKGLLKITSKVTDVGLDLPGVSSEPASEELIKTYQKKTKVTPERAITESGSASNSPIAINSSSPGSNPTPSRNVQVTLLTFSFNKFKITLFAKHFEFHLYVVCSQSLLLSMWIFTLT